MLMYCVWILAYPSYLKIIKSGAISVPLAFCHSWRDINAYYIFKRKQKVRMNAHYLSDTITYLHIINLPYNDTITIFEMNFRFSQRGQISHPSSISKQMAQAEVEPDLKHEGFPFYFTRYCLSLPQCYPLPQENLGILPEGKAYCFLSKEQQMYLKFSFNSIQFVVQP